METVDRKTVRSWLGSYDYIFIDIRDKKLLDASQEKIERARHLDPTKISTWGKELPKDKKIVCPAATPKPTALISGRNWISLAFPRSMSSREAGRPGSIITCHGSQRTGRLDGASI